MLKLLKLISRATFFLIFLIYYSEIKCFSQNPIQIQAEDANTINTGTIDNSDQGYTGAGYVNLDNREGTYVEWVIDIPSSGYNTIAVRFANGSANRTMNILVNDVVVKQNHNFVSTGAWTSWSITNIQVSLQQGVNNLKFAGSNPESGPSLDYIILSNSNNNNVDWSVEMANMIVNTRSNLPWDYTEGLLLEGILRVYKRTNDTRYLDYIRQWGESHISADGTIGEDINSLDFIMPGFMLLHLYSETGIERFKLAADKLRTRFDNYPRTPDGGFWHMTNLQGELWLDGLYMGMPFLVTYGQMFGDENYAYVEAIKQFKLHIDYLMDNETGLLYHAFDYDGSESWALPPDKRSPYVWGRAVGWVVMGLSEILDIIPDDFPDRNVIVEQYKTVLKALAAYQDPSTGLWYQVIDHQSDPGNWLETSCSMMFVYSMSRAIQKGFLDDSYKTNVDLGYNGILSKISEDADKMVSLTDICEGTSVSSDINYYFGRSRITNDNHGVGTFLIMNELLQFNNLPWLLTHNSLNITPTESTIGSASGTTGTLNVTSNTGWNVSDNASWLNLSAASGTGNGTITVTATIANTSVTPRIANVTFSATGASSVTVYVTQSGLILTIPVLSTTPVSEITSNTARSGGTVLDDGGAPVIFRGICWSTNENPTVDLNTKTSDGSGTGLFISIMNGLAPGTFYYIRAYATNIIGTGYGEVVSFRCDVNTDIIDTQNSEIIVFPNPVSGLISIKNLNDDFESINILNSQGLILANERVITPIQYIDFSKYKSGLYILEFVKGKSIVKRVKVLKQ